MADIVAGIVAHVDAGKTTLSEALLYRSGMLRRPGRVDDGDAFLDTDALEKRRGITIFPHEAVLRGAGGTVTLLDTPGHADFAASAESVLPVLDAAVLVVSAADGIQASTRLLWRLLERQDVPVIIFANKCDALGADPAGVLKSLQEGFSPQIVPFVPMPDGQDGTAGAGSAKSSADACDAADAGDDPVTAHTSGVGQSPVRTDGTVIAAIPQDSLEQMASVDDHLIDSYLQKGTLDASQIRGLVARRQAFPAFFGSALRLEGVDGLLDALTRWVTPRFGTTGRDAGAGTGHDAGSTAVAGSDTASGSSLGFSARVFRVSHEDGERLTWLRVLSGTLRAKQEILPGQKADQIRLYDGSHFTTVRQVGTGGVATVTGPVSTRAGQGIGTGSGAPLVRPVLQSSIEAPGTDPRALEQAVRELADEEPLLDPRWRGKGGDARLVVSLMGDLEEEILTSELADRFGITVTFGPPRVLYSETISAPVEGVGHFEPLRHYAEVHVRLDPAPRGSGITVRSALSTDDLSASWQHQILSRLATHTPVGVLTGSPLTDVEITLVAARESNVHTVGGDFRQATDRAVRQGLMTLRTRGGDDDTGGVVLLEPWQAFRLELPENLVGRAMNDLQRRGAAIAMDGAPAGRAVLEGSAPAAALQGYAREARAYSHGEASLELTPDGSRPVADPMPVIRQIGYDPVVDLDNPPGSVFCAHGAGYPVPWDRVPEIMHLPWAEPDLRK